MPLGKNFKHYICPMLLSMSTSLCRISIYSNNYGVSQHSQLQPEFSWPNPRLPNPCRNSADNFSTLRENAYGLFLKSTVSFSLQMPLPFCGSYFKMVIDHGHSNYPILRCQNSGYTRYLSKTGSLC